MAELIIAIILFISLCGITLILLRKLPALHTLPKNGTIGFKKHHYIVEIESKIKNILVAFEKQIWLHKLLSWIKVVVLRVEVKIDHLLHNLRQKNKPS